MFVTVVVKTYNELLLNVDTKCYLKFLLYFYVSLILFFRKNSTLSFVICKLLT